MKDRRNPNVPPGRRTVAARPSSPARIHTPRSVEFHEYRTCRLLEALVTGGKGLCEFFATSRLISPYASAQTARSQSRRVRGLTDWRAGCGRSARPVRREGWGRTPSLPLSQSNCMDTAQRAAWASRRGGRSGRGSQILKVVPRPTTLSKSIRPPWSRIIR